MEIINIIPFFFEFMTDFDDFDMIRSHLTINKKASLSLNFRVPLTRSVTPKQAIPLKKQLYKFITKIYRQGTLPMKTKILQYLDLIINFLSPEEIEFFI